MGDGNTGSKQLGVLSKISRKCANCDLRGETGSEPMLAWDLSYQKWRCHPTDVFLKKVGIQLAQIGQFMAAHCSPGMQISATEFHIPNLLQENSWFWPVPLKFPMVLAGIQLGASLHGGLIFYKLQFTTGNH